MVRTVLKLALALLLAHALYQFVPVYINYHQFRDDMKQAALFGGGATEHELVQQVLLHAQVRDIPVESTGVSVSRLNNQTFIEAAYEQPVKVLPWYTYVWHVELDASAMHVHAPKGSSR
jgi:hypothetical protein